MLDVRGEPNIRMNRKNIITEVSRNPVLVSRNVGRDNFSSFDRKQSCDGRALT
jgi:hypothetical protein